MGTYYSGTRDSRFIVIAEERYVSLRQNHPSLDHPLKYIYVNPMEIAFDANLHKCTKENKGSKLYDICTVRNGEWDIDRAQLGWNAIGFMANAVYSRYCCGLDWPETEAYKRKLRVIKTGKMIDECRTEEELRRRYKRLDDVFSNIILGGFKRQDELPSGRLEDEMFVSIGRSGQHYFASGGNHRLAIARLLRIPRIPCLVMTRHLMWQSLKDEYNVNRNQGKNNLNDVMSLIRSRHPDIEG